MNLPPLRVRTDGRRLETADQDARGKGFFWLGDTAWELTRRLTLAQTDMYCRTRAAQGFNLIQVVVISEFSSRVADTGNIFGDYALHDWNPERPNEAYFAHLDAQLGIAANHGLYVGLLPTWGDKVGPLAQGLGPEIFTPSNAQHYGRWIGGRYRDQPHLVWIIGGDRSPTEARHLETWRALAQGIRDGGAEQLMTFHPQGETSSGFYVHAEPWLQCNMVQSGHASRDNPLCHALIAVDSVRQPSKPVINGEPCYEDHPINWKLEQGTFSALDVRRAAYWSAFSGACGITYGHYSVFMFHETERPGVWAHPSMLNWYDALERSGAKAMQHLRSLLESYPKASPAQEAIRGHTADVRALRDAKTLLVYSPDARAIHMALDGLHSAICFDPRDGSRHALSPGQGFTPPAGIEDWVLILEYSS